MATGVEGGRRCEEGMGRCEEGMGRCEKGRGSLTSFENFLRLIPRLDPVDRTVDWVMSQPVLDTTVSIYIYQ